MKALISIILGVVLSACALRAEDAEKPHKKDGTEREAMKERREKFFDAMFDRIDTNKDGKIDKEELKAAIKRFKEKHPDFFKKMMEEIREHHEQREQKKAGK